MGRSTTGRLEVVGASAKTGFETAISVPGGTGTFEVQALGSGGSVIGVSRAVGVTA
jgi:hypothetical protein